MARFSGGIKSKAPGGSGGPKSVPSIGAPSNVLGNRSGVLRAPRLKMIPTREYGKPVQPTTPYPPSSNFGGSAGFGSTGLPPGST